VIKEEEWEETKIQNELEKDDEFKDILKKRKSNFIWEDKEKDKRVTQEAEDFRWENNRLYHIYRKNKREHLCLVVPESLRQAAIRAMHCDKLHSHLGGRKTVNAMRTTFYWKMMRKDTKEFVRKCETCAKVNAPNQRSTGLLVQPEATTKPLERVGIDFMKLPKTKRKSQYVLLAVDHHTGWLETKATKNKEAETVAKFFRDRFTLRLGSPLQLWSDQGKEFLNQTMDWIRKWGGVKGVKTSGYNPQANGKTERANRTIKEMLTKLMTDYKENWDQLLPYATYAYNISTNERTGITPFEGMFGGRFPRIPLQAHLMVGTIGDETITAQQLREGTELMNEIIERNSASEKKHQAEQYNKGRQESPLAAGMTVMWRVRSQGKGRSAKNFRELYRGPFKIVRIQQNKALATIEHLKNHHIYENINIKYLNRR